jgi:4-diphosphocytidyl-2-C-methyl-D-erythritol kinase
MSASGPARASRARAVRVRAFAKINLSLRVLARRPDGYHELRTTFQSIALHDTLTITRRRGPFQIDADDPACPIDATNLVWRAAEALWCAAGRRGPVADVHVAIRKRIPVRGGLGGGSSDAASALRALSWLWRLSDPRAVDRVAALLGADVPYFLRGGAALGLERGDLLFQLAEPPTSWVVVVIPGFGVGTQEAFGWWDQQAEPTRSAINDLQAPVIARRPEIGAIVRALDRAGARNAAMSGSGSAVFGLFDAPSFARRAAQRLAAPRALPRGCRLIVTRTLARARFAAESAPVACG